MARCRFPGSPATRARACRSDPISTPTRCGFAAFTGCGSLGGMKLIETLPLLTREMQSALLQIGRGDIVDQLREAIVDRWEFDDFANSASIFVTHGDAAPPP